MDFGIIYQVAISLGKPFHQVSFEGPFKSAAAEVSVYRDTIKKKLLPGEKPMTDKAYWGDETCWTPTLGKITMMSESQKIERRKLQ